MRLRPAARVLPAALLLVASLTAAACGGEGTPGDTETTAAGAATPTPPGVSADDGDTPAAPLTAADLDAYERALTAEVELLRDAVRRRETARTGADTLAAMTAAMEAETQPAAAARAGIDEARYRRLDAAFGRAIGARLQSPGMRGMFAEMDTSFLAELPAAQAEERRAELRESMRQMEAAYGDSATYASVPPALREAFRARAEARLDALWTELLRLRMSAAGLGG